MKFLNLSAVLIALCVAATTHAATPRSESSGSGRVKERKSRKIVTEAGLNIPAWGVAIDAAYDSRLDNLIPGYKILNVILTNRGASTIYLDPRKDRWGIQDHVNNSHQGINHLRLHNEKVWFNLPDGLRAKLEYPTGVRAGNSTKIDLFFPTSVELGHFRGVTWNSSHFKKEFSVYTTGDKTDGGDDRNEPIPKTRSTEQAAQKYEGEELLKNFKKEGYSPAARDEIREEPVMPDIISLPSIRDE